MITITIPNFDIELPVDEVNNIPKNKAGIYLFYGANNDLLYIGKTKLLRQRIRQHLLSNDINTELLRHHFVFVRCIYVDDSLERDIYETYMVNTLRPLFNIDKVLVDKRNKKDLRKYYEPEVLAEIEKEEAEFRGEIARKIQARRMKY